MKKKLFALLLCFAMIVSVSIPIALANTGDEPADPPSDAQAPTGTPASSATPESSVTPESSATPSTDPAAPATPTPETTLTPEATLTPTLTPIPTPDLAAMAAALYEQLMACQTLAGLESVLAGFAEDGADVDALLAAFTDAQRAAYEEHRAKLETLAAFIPPVDFTKAAAFMPPVKGAALRRGFALTGEPDPAEALKLSKTASANTDDSYTLSLEAYTTGTVTNTETNVPTDIILVLDESGSMDYSFGGTYDPVWGGEYELSGHTYYGFNNDSSYFVLVNGSYYEAYRRPQPDSNGFYYYRYRPGNDWIHVYPKLDQNPTGVSRQNDDWAVVQFYAPRTRNTALKIAALAFSEAVEAKAQAPGNNVNHRIAVVGFSSESRLYLGSTGIQSPTDAEYRAALQDMSTSVGAANVEASINNLLTNGSTYINLGINKANSIFAYNPIPANTQRNRVVIVFTDGEPSAGYDDPIAAARTAKQTYGATVYTIGIFSGANVGVLGSLPPSGANRFMHLMSSNYPDASSMSSTGSINPNLNGKSYYLAASDTGALNDIFENISGQITNPAIKLGTGTVIKDVIPACFKLQAGAGQIKIYTAAANAGGTTFQDKVQVYPAASPSITPVITGEGKTVSVSGFNFDENFVSANPRTGNFYGKKLIIEIIVEPEAGFLGGNGVRTNGAESGVYSPGTPPTLVKAFPQPTVNVPIKSPVQVTVQDKNVYLLSSLTEAQLKAGTTAAAGTGAGQVTLNWDLGNFGLQTWQNEYVDINTAFTPAIGSGDLTNLTADKTYALTVTIAPKAGSVPSAVNLAATAQSSSPANIHVNVFKPKLKFRDSEVFYGADAPASPDDYGYNFMGPAAWKHGDDQDTGVTMTGTKPTLTLTYTPEAGTILGSNPGTINTKHDIKVAVTVSIGETGVTDKTAFVHEACTSACAWDSLSSSTNPSSPAFLLHVKTCQLTIQKNGGAAGEPYVFNIKRNGDDYMTVSITGSGSKTIYELPVGEYTVEEEGKWSWRYEGSATGSASLGSTKQNDTLTCTNEQKTDKTKWLNGYDLEINSHSLPAGSGN